MAGMLVSDNMGSGGRMYYSGEVLSIPGLLVNVNSVGKIVKNTTAGGLPDYMTFKPSFNHATGQAADNMPTPVYPLIPGYIVYLKLVATNEAIEVGDRIMATDTGEVDKYVDPGSGNYVYSIGKALEVKVQNAGDSYTFGAGGSAGEPYTVKVFIKPEFMVGSE